MKKKVKRIKYFRKRKGMTQKELGLSVGFTENQASVRIAQYEQGYRTPNKNLIDKLAHSLEVSPEALNVPNIDNYIGLMHSLFALEDIYGLRIGELNGKLFIGLSKLDINQFLTMFQLFSNWNDIYQQLKDEQLSKKEYDEWRYNYPTSNGVTTPQEKMK